MAKAANKLIYGVGINDADYTIKIIKIVGYKEDGKPIQKLIWSCPFYEKWKDMMRRCYSVRFQDKNPAYKNSKVTPEWHYFTTFRAWMEKQDWKDKQLDKDILIPGNKIYGPETCIFIDQVLNKFMTERAMERGSYPIGVTFNKAVGKIAAQCSDFSIGKQRHLGYFDSPAEAFVAWLSFKLSQAHILAAEQSDPRVAAALIDRYENYAKYFPNPLD